MDKQTVDRVQLAAVYDNYAQVRRDAGKEQWKVSERSIYLKVIQSADAHNLLEIGAGTGEDSLFFQEAGFNVTAIDLSPRHVEMTRELGVRAMVMDFYDLKFPENNFDAVFLMNALVNVPTGELTYVLRNIERVVKPGGLIFIGEYGGEDFEGIRENDKYKPSRFFRFYFFDDFKSILEKMFDIDRSKKQRLSGGMEFHSFILRKRSS